MRKAEVIKRYTVQGAGVTFEVQLPEPDPCTLHLILINPRHLIYAINFLNVVDHLF